MSRLSIEGSVCFHSVQFVFRSNIFRKVAIATGILWLSYQPKLEKTAICLKDEPYIRETFDFQHPKSYDQMATHTPTVHCSFNTHLSMMKDNGQAIVHT